jgi:hypothetical protein
MQEVVKSSKQPDLKRFSNVFPRYSTPASPTISLRSQSFHYSRNGNPEDGLAEPASMLRYGHDWRYQMG